MKNNWYEKQPKKTRDFTALTKTYDEKYGDFDYTKDSRSIDRSFSTTLLAAMGDLGGKHVLVCGSNSGYEIKILRRHFPTARFVAVDISEKALAKLPADVSRIHACMEDLPFKDNAFDIYLSCRAVHSSNVHLKRALSEAMRVTRGRIVISISGGYLIKGGFVRGMYDYLRRCIDADKPDLIARKVENTFNRQGFRVANLRSKGELFVVAR